MSKQFDVVVFGATSFVGQILTRYLWDRHGLQGEIKWAIAGRSESKLNELKAELGTKAASLPVIIANADNATELEQLCAQTSVVCSTVGPYALYGNTLVELCANSGTHYCDLTGEVQWIDRMIQANEAAAKKSGAKIVHCCGFDSIPSDLGVYYHQQQALALNGETSRQIKMRVRRLKGEFSGGTVASLINVTKEVTANPGLAKKLGNPYLIATSNPRVRQPNIKFAQYENDTGSWAAPFVMAAINTKVVHRSNSLMDWSYGEDFKYDEAMMTGQGLRGRLMATGVSAGLAGFLVGAAIKPSRWFLEKYVVPKPGEGPSQASQDAGFYDLRFFGSSPSGKTLQTKVYGDKDPGYGSTAKMLGEAAACLAKDVSDKPGGFWTTSTLMGQALIDRLEKHAGLSFSVVDN